MIFALFILLVVAGVSGALIAMLVHVIGVEIATARRIGSIRRDTRRMIRLLGDPRP